MGAVSIGQGELEREHAQGGVSVHLTTGEKEGSRCVLKFWDSHFIALVSDHMLGEVIERM